MPTPPSTDNYTVPGGIILYFDDGTGERDLGNITGVDIEPGTEELEHYTNRSGKRMKDKVISLEDQLKIKFKFDEPVIENLAYYFKGGSEEDLGPDSTAVYDMKRFPIAGATFVEGSARLEIHPDAGRGLRFDIDIPKCLLKPDGNLSLDDKNWMETPLMLEALDDTENTPAAPFGYVTVYDLAAS